MRTSNFWILLHLFLFQNRVKYMMVPKMDQLVSNTSAYKKETLIKVELCLLKNIPPQWQVLVCGFN